MTIKILGMKKLKAKFARFPDEVTNGIRKAMERSADGIVDMARNLVPKTGSTGELEESIGWTWGKAPRGSMTLGAVRGKVEDGALTITIYAGNSDAFYARWVEFGTAAHSTAKGGGTVLGKIANKLSGGKGQHPGTAAQPFFFVSYRARKKSARASINASVTRAAKKLSAT